MELTLGQSYWWQPLEGFYQRTWVLASAILKSSFSLISKTSQPHQAACWHQYWEDSDQTDR